MTPEQIAEQKYEQEALTELRQIRYEYFKAGYEVTPVYENGKPYKWHVHTEWVG